MMITRSSHSFALLLSAALLSFPAWSTAQTIYRIVSPDGKVTFSDRAPAPGQKATALGPGGRLPDEAVDTGNLPYDLRQAMLRYPVTLYTGDKCDACGAARSLLTTRGIPYTEKTIMTADDVEALQKLGIEATVPTLTIGGQRLKGYSEGEWTEYLDAAGYPKSSELPSSYRNPPAAPLVPLPTEAPKAAETPAAPAQQPGGAPPAGPTPDNPTGIVF